MALRETDSVVSFIQTADAARSVAFYRDIMGLKVDSVDPFGTALAQPGGGILRITQIDGFEPAPHPALGWTVSDIRAALIRLTTQGVVMEIYEGLGQDGDGVWTDTGRGVQLCWFKDPDGNLLSLKQD